jgi:cysteine-rich repeat protein
MWRLAFVAAAALLLADAAAATTCGDTAPDTGEECDGGNTILDDGCDANCRLEICSNGGPPQTHIDEECDDGSLVEGDGCNDDCQLDCGDGEADAGETCDDGNEINGDGCGDDAEGFGSQQGNCTVSACGNGVRVPPGEECDEHESPRALQRDLRAPV